MEVEKISFSMDSLIAHLQEQVPVESAIPLPAGRTAGNVLSVSPRLQVREVRIEEGGVRLSGQLLLRILLETAERTLYSFEAAAEFTHLMRQEGLPENGQARVFGQLLKCVCHREGDGLRLSAVLDLQVWVLAPQQVAAVSSLAGEPGLEQRQGEANLCHRSLLGAKALQIQEEAGVPAGTQVLEAQGAVRILSYAPAPEGMGVNGQITTSLVLLTPQGRLEETVKQIPFSDAVKADGPLSGAFVAGELTGFSARVEGEALLMSADVSLSVYGRAQSRSRLLQDAYDEQGSFCCHRQTAQGLSYEGNVFAEQTVEGALAVPNHLPEVQEVLYSRAIPALLQGEQRAGMYVWEGVALVTTVYRCESGLLHSFTGELPFALTLSGAGELLLPGFVAAFSTVSGRGRQLQARVTLLAGAEAYAQTAFTYTDDLLAGPGVEQSRGILLYAPGPEETMFDLGRRFGVSQQLLLSWNEGLQEPFSGSERVLIIR